MVAQHGSPNESLGWAIPFGYPWTWPNNDLIATSLYDQLIELIPEIYSGFRRDIYIQRFRESWFSQIEFLKSRGWKQIARLPLFGRETDNALPLSSDVVHASRDDLELLSKLSGLDEVSKTPWSLEDAQSRYDNGWIVHDTFWRLGDRGVFILEPRGRYAAITVLFAKPEAWQETVQSAITMAHSMNVQEVYFTVDPKERDKINALNQLDFREVDAGVYYTREAD